MIRTDAISWRCLRAADENTYSNSNGTDLVGAIEAKVVAQRHAIHQIAG